MNQKEALAWIADIFEEPLENVTPETLRSALNAWDSLGILTLMARFDEDLDVQLTESELQELRSVGDVLDTLTRHGKLN